MVKKLAIVILNWNGRHFLERFLPGVVKYSDLDDVRVVIADNASSDDSLEWLAGNYPQLDVLKFSENYGFAGGYNLAFEQLEDEIICLLNSDVEIRGDWLQPVLDYFVAEDEIAAISSKLLNQKQPEYFEYASAAGGYIDKFGYPFCRGRIFESIEKDQGQYDVVEDVLWGAGAALFVRRKIWLELGGLDVDFFAHMEEIDLCWRINNAGYRVVSLPQSVVYHVGGGTLPKNNPWKTFLNFRNNLWMLQKNLPKRQRNRVMFIRFFLDRIAAVSFLFSGRFKDASAVCKAWWNVWKTRNHTLAKRNRMTKFSGMSGKGFYKGSILWQYHVKKNKRFKDLTI
ncbi:MAG: glycosyltransferase family 2 protein [Bacteroidota bacterium]|nr:glycosyltransferase family 2 protein [Bacteroidota bacterium]